MKKYLAVIISLIMTVTVIPFACMSVYADDSGVSQVKKVASSSKKTASAASKYKSFNVNNKKLWPKITCGKLSKKQVEGALLCLAVCSKSHIKKGYGNELAEFSSSGKRIKSKLYYLRYPISVVNRMFSFYSSTKLKKNKVYSKKPGHACKTDSKYVYYGMDRGNFVSWMEMVSGKCNSKYIVLSLKMPTVGGYVKTKYYKATLKKQKNGRYRFAKIIKVKK